MRGLPLRPLLCHLCTLSLICPQQFLFRVYRLALLHPCNIASVAGTEMRLEQRVRAGPVFGAGSNNTNQLKLSTDITIVLSGRAYVC